MLTKFACVNLDVVRLETEHKTSVFSRNIPISSDKKICPIAPCQMSNHPFDMTNFDWTFFRVTRYSLLFTIKARITPLS